MKTRIRKTASIVTLGLVGALALAGCSASAEDSDSKGTITFSYLEGWPDGVSLSYLLEDQLTKLGYTVEMEPLSEVGVLFSAMSSGDIDLYPSAWPEISQQTYMERYGDDLEDLGTYYPNAQIFLAVPDYVEDINSVEDLKGQADRFGGKIYTIEPGSGTAETAQKSLFPNYQLDDEYELTTSSTAAMMAQIDTAMAAEEPVVATLWRPYWAMDSYDVKELDDPQNSFGESEGLHFMGRKGFSDDFPDAAALMSKITLDDAQYSPLEKAVVDAGEEGTEAEAVDAWLDEYGDQFDWVVDEE